MSNIKVAVKKYFFFICNKREDCDKYLISIKYSNHCNQPCCLYQVYLQWSLGFCPSLGCLIFHIFTFFLISIMHVLFAIIYIQLTGGFLRAVKPRMQTALGRWIRTRRSRLPLCKPIYVLEIACEKLSAFDQKCNANRRLIN